MKNSIPQWLIVAFLIVAALGFIDSLYLSIHHVQGTAVSCSILDGCDIVANSQYASWGAIPVSFAGMFYYITVLFFGLLYTTTKKENILKLAAALTFFGFIASLWFVYVQAFIINAFCFYCILSALSSTLLFIFAIIIKRRLSKRS